MLIIINIVYIIEANILIFIFLNKTIKGINKSILPIIFITLGILIHIIYLDLFYPNKYMSSKESSFLTEESQEVVSSSESNIAKTNFENEEPQGYYLTVMEGKIVVMETDQKTIYLTTDIYAEALSESLKQELIKGKFIHSIEELYGFLESYTS